MTLSIRKSSLYLIILITCISCCESVHATGSDLSPVYIPPNPDADKSRLEAGEADFTNRGESVRGERVRGTLRGTRGATSMSESLTEDLSQMIVTNLKGKKISKSKKVIFPKRLVPIASEQTGFTSNSQPNLYWYISAQYQGAMEFKLLDRQDTQPVMSVKLTGSPAEGIYGLKLREYNVQLKPGIEYEWFITIITDPQERSGDIYASATIMYVEPSNDLNDKFNTASLEQRYYVYAKNGYWYDSISSLSSLIEQYATTKKYRLHRAALLKQVNLTKVARYDLSLVNIP
jgi:hypothetical protein